MILQFAVYMLGNRGSGEEKNSNAEPDTKRFLGNNSCL